jgi:tetratricopeptide (TPR) repeat protein
MEYTESGTPDDMDSDAARLFLETAVRVTSNPFDTPEDLRAIVGICKTVEGLPLGIELAASWSRHMELEEILGEMSDPSFLQVDYRDMPERHRSIAAVFEYSWKLLSPEEKIAFEALAVFQGAFEKLAAQNVAGVRFGHLVALVDKSLVHQTGTGRYRLHPLLKQQAYVKLGEHSDRLADVEARHCEYYLGLVAKRQEDLISGDRSAAVGGLERELDNIKAAWEKAVELTRFDLIESCLRGMTSLLAVKGQFREADRLLGQAIDRLSGTEGEQALLLADLLAQRGWAASHFRPYQECLTMLEMSIDLFRSSGDDAGLAYGLNNFANILNVKGEDDRAAKLYAESLEIQRKLGDPHGVSAALNNLGILAERRKDRRQARQLYREAMLICKEQKNQHGVSVCLSNLSTVARDEGKIGEAMEMLHEALKIEHSIGDEFNKALIRCYMVELQIIEGKLEKAKPMAMECLGVFQEQGHAWGTVRAEILLSLIALEQGMLTEAGSILLQSMKLLEEHRWTVLYAETMAVCAELLEELGRHDEARTVVSVAVHAGPLQQYLHDRIAVLLGRLREHLTLEEEQECGERGRQFSMEEALEYVREDLTALLGK